MDKEINLDELEKEIEYALEHKHFADITSEEEIKEKGIDVGEMFYKQMKKIDQIYKYLFKLKKENDHLKEEIRRLQNK